MVDEFSVSGWNHYVLLQVCDGILRTVLRASASEQRSLSEHSTVPQSLMRTCRFSALAYGVPIAQGQFRAHAIPAKTRANTNVVATKAMLAGNAIVYDRLDSIISPLTLHSNRGPSIREI